MSSPTALETRSGSYNPAKSWKALLLLAPIIGMALFVSYKTHSAPTVQKADAVRPISAADGKVHAVEPQFGLDAPMWDGHVAWQPYPHAASYDVVMLNDRKEVVWKETTNADHIYLHTESFPRDLRMRIELNYSVGYAITARDRSGNVIAESGPQYFYLKVPPQPGFDPNS